MSPREIWAVDFEFIAKPGERPDVVCLVAREIRSGRVIRGWRDELGDASPYATGPETLFVAYAAQAELACHLALGWPLPANVVDLLVEFRRHTNGGNVNGKGLLDALEYFGLPGIGSAIKDATRARILQGWPFSETEKQDILRYCQSDVDELAALWLRMEPQLDLDRALARGRFVAVSAEMEHRGVPIDPMTWRQLSDPATWEGLRTSTIAEIDAEFDVYEGDSFRLHRFEAYLSRTGIPWPRLDSGQLDLKRQTFREMAKAHPRVAPLYELRHHVSELRRIQLAVGSDGRNRTVLWPFASKTSRTQPKASQYIFGPSCWLRSLIKPDPGEAVAYVDFSSAEFGIAAALSGDKRMREVYRSGDPYLGCAKLFGLAPPEATKQTHAAVRDSLKITLLATQYCMTAQSLADRLGVSTIVARELLMQHRWHFPRYWNWSQGWFERACQTGEMRSRLGWAMRLERPVKERTIRNWPIQTNGAEILRVAALLAARLGVPLLAPVHDAFLIGSSIDRIETEAARLRECMRRAARAVLGGFELRTDSKIVRYPERYSDPRGGRMWQVVTGLLERENERRA